MRIGETKLCQFVEGDPPTLVLIEETTGEEIVLDPLELARAEFAIAYFHVTGAVPSGTEACEAAGHPPFRVDEGYAAAVCLCNTVLYDSTSGQRVGTTT